MNETSQGQLATTSYFDGRPDARFFAAVIGDNDIVVSIRENLPTHGVTAGEVWAAWRSDDRLVEHRFMNIDAARQRLAQIVRGEPWPVLWVLIERAAYAVACPICEAAFACPCVSDGEPMLARKGSALIVGAPWRPEPHTVEVALCPLVHAGRSIRHHQALHGERGART